MNRFHSALVGILVVGVTSTRAEEKEIKVTVVAILGSTKSAEIDKSLAEFAKQARMKDPSLTGFRIAKRYEIKFPLGDTQTLKLLDDQSVEVTVNEKTDEQGRVTLTIKPPKMQQITYACVCNKYLPIATEHTTKDNERLFLAVMAKPCLANPPDKK